MSTTDRELLALAAKAAGKSRAEWDYDWLMENGTEVARDMLWDPRRDGGQAFDLCLQLHIRVSTNPDGSGFAEDIDGNHCAAFRSPDNDFGPAARRAVFLVATDIGRAMP